jgi:hypothetical protein
MNSSTQRPTVWSLVKVGDPVFVPCEGGYVAETAIEPGALLHVEGHPGIFVPETMMHDAISLLEQLAKPTKRKGK